MQTTLKRTTIVLPGNRVELTLPELPEGAEVEIAVTVSDRTAQENLTSHFARLADRWRRETAMLSSVTQIAMHPAYQEIIGMGQDAVPLILRELEQRPDHWFWALRAITSADPILPEQRGKVDEMAAAWLTWEREQGYQW